MAIYWCNKHRWFSIITWRHKILAHFPTKEIFFRTLRIPSCCNFLSTFSSKRHLWKQMLTLLLHHFLLYFTNQDDLVGAAVYVGSCSLNPIQTNVRCGAKVTSGEIVEDQPLYRSCPANTYGQYINIIGTGSTASQLKLCDVVLHKRTSRYFD